VQMIDLHEPLGFLNEREFLEAGKEASPSTALTSLPVVE
jgi:hypothetical protein